MDIGEWTSLQEYIGRHNMDMCGWTAANNNNITAPPRMPLPALRVEEASHQANSKHWTAALKSSYLSHILFATAAQLGTADVAHACSVCRAWREAGGKHAALLASCLAHAPVDSKLKAFESISRLSAPLNNDDRLRFGSVLATDALRNQNLRVRERSLSLLGHGEPRLAHAQHLFAIISREPVVLQTTHAPTVSCVQVGLVVNSWTRSQLHQHKTVRSL